MKRNHTLDMCHYRDLNLYKQRVAYHEAGHAAAILINNRLKSLPPVFFKIQLGDFEDSPNVLSGKKNSQTCIARIKGGRLIQPLPLSFHKTYPNAGELTNAIVFQFNDGYHRAFEADIVNLLIGSLAEAKFIALMDDEPFIAELFTVQALNNYGGEADIAVVNDYLQSYFSDPQAREESLMAYLKQAF